MARSKSSLYLDASFHIFDPPRGALQSVGSHDVIRKVSVDDSDDFRRRNILGE
jgi:hypothetical protein